MMKAWTIFSTSLVLALVSGCAAEEGTGSGTTADSSTAMSTGTGTTGTTAGDSTSTGQQGTGDTTTMTGQTTGAGNGGTTTTGMGTGTVTQGMGGATNPTQVTGNGGAAAIGNGGAPGNGGTPGTVTGGGGAVTATGGNTSVGMGGAAVQSGGAGGMGSGGQPDPGGTGGANTTGGEEELPDDPEAFDCGPDAFTIESHGPPANRVNYVIVGDGYSQAELETTYLEHIDVYMQKRFSAPIGEPYLRYRKWVNICAVKLASSGGICGNSALGCCGDDGSRLANCNSGAANQAISNGVASIPDFDVDWTAVVLNGSDWWNTGATLMLWSGGNNDADGAALHEGGHGFHRLTDEYGACGTNLVNGASGSQDANGKWGIWMDFVQSPGTGQQGEFQCDGSNLRPSSNSMMNSLFGDNENTSYNAISREKMIFDFWRFTRPVDSVSPPEGSVSGTTVLRVNVIDADVIDVNWSVNGTLVEEDGGAEFDVATMGSGTYEVTAFAFDNAGEDLVRYRDGGDWGRADWERSQQEVSWTVTVP